MNIRKNILFIMPFGKKGGYDFDLIYHDFKAILCDYDVYRVDTMVGSNIDEKMYKGIASADIVIADISIENG